MEMKRAIDFTNIYFYTILYPCTESIQQDGQGDWEHRSITLRIQSMQAESSLISTRRSEWKPATKKVAKLFKDSKIDIPTQSDWEKLKKSVMKHGTLQSESSGRTANGIN
jgi:ribonucleoside-diphosphate reductase alpha chain